MAANLNKPADFLATPKVSRDVVLIPPSEFEKPKIFQVKELEKIKQQIEDLRQENERLRSVQSQSQSQIQVPSFSLPHNEYADELIKRQGGEIAELKSELIKCRQAYKQEVGEWNRKVEFMEEEHRHELKRLEKEWERKEDEFEQRYARISSELQRTLEDTETETSVLNDKLEKTRTALSNRVKELEDTLNVVQRESERTLNQQDVELRNKSRIIEDQAHQISKLKTYIGEAEQTHKPAHVWRVEKETVENKLKIARAENEKLQSELELMDVRFKALSDILAVQEAELSKPNTEGLGLSKQQNLLITRWREKVFSLLVQQKSSEIVHKNDVNNLNQKIRDLTDKLAASDANVEVFKLSLVDKSAQLQMERNSKERLQQELDHLNKVAICLDDQSRDSLESVKGLTEFIERIYQKNKVQMKVMEEKSNVLKVMCQRVSFAASRMDLLKAQIIRKSAIDFSYDKSSSASILHCKEKEESNIDDDHLQHELEKVMKERDSLAYQVRQDSTTWTERLSELKSNYITEIAALKKTVEDLEFDVQEKSKKCAQLKEELEFQKEEIKEKSETIQNLKTELNKYAKGVDNVLAEHRLQDEAAWNTKIAALERKLNDSKREHAKAVISMRQMERNHSRELERAQDLLQTTEEHLNKQLKRIQNELLRVEKERNLMMATLRQEGLISNLKSERGDPIKLSFGAEDQVFLLSNNNFNTCTNTEPHKLESLMQRSDKEGDNVMLEDIEKVNHKKVWHHEESHRNNQEAMEDVLEDLKSLTVAIFDENDEDSSDS